MDQNQELLDQYRLVNPVKRRVERPVDTEGDSYKKFREQTRFSSSKKSVELDLTVSPITLVRHPINPTEVNHIPLSRDVYTPTVEKSRWWSAIKSTWRCIY